MGILYDAIVLGFYGHPIKALLACVISGAIGAYSMYSLIQYEKSDKTDNSPFSIVIPFLFFNIAIPTNSSPNIRRGFLITLIYVGFAGSWNCITGIVRNLSETSTEISATDQKK